MFYVRHIEAGHDEVIYEAQWVRFTRTSGSHEPPAGLHLILADGSNAYLDDGVAYVMGENGQTVAKYHIRDIIHTRSPEEVKGGEEESRAA